jgi:uncharacterized phage protein (TIGR01671 family)
MRFKFRAWDKERKEMRQVRLMDWSDWWVTTGGTWERLPALEYGERNSFNNEETDRHILMQYTGLVDRNGKDIYEGDIIKGEAITWSDSGHYAGTRVTLGIVKYDHARFYLEDKETSARPDLAMGSAYHEIIGNIYEHPELLEGP